MSDPIHGTAPPPETWVDDYPRIDTPAVRAAAEAIAAVYEHNGAGGHLHIVLDDDNVGDGSLDYCGEVISQGGYRSNTAFAATTEQLDAERRCYELLKPLSEDERLSAIGLYGGHWKP